MGPFCRKGNKAMLPKVYIIVLNWNSWQETLECLGMFFAMTTLLTV